eukprot:CAMPEP_0178442790 /NCGR_PEP_ID=MMETSP0689_2-20121128/38413_1 /TAXON_ID=160604 /ORGANISM="Amphidinium massartii, Strain CS-259" /LENGTH=360 /DNA_ID=CAMNT_0020066481 /DNA_START=23 /DNA_END=1105 /DNA_ORIENTATION=-
MRPWLELPMESYQVEVEHILMQHAKQTAREIRTELAKTMRAQSEALVASVSSRSSSPPRSVATVASPAWTRGFYDRARLADCEGEQPSPMKKTQPQPETTGLSYSVILRNAFKLKDIAHTLRDEARERAEREEAEQEALGQLEGKVPPTPSRQALNVNSLIRSVSEIGTRCKALRKEATEGALVSAASPAVTTKPGASQLVTMPSNEVLLGAVNKIQEEEVKAGRERLGSVTRAPVLTREYSVGQTSVFQTSETSPPQAGGMESPTESPQSKVRVPPPSPVYSGEGQQPISSRAVMEAWERREQTSLKSAQAERLAAQTADLHRTLAEITANLEKAQVIGPPKGGSGGFSDSPSSTSPDR